MDRTECIGCEKELFLSDDFEILIEGGSQWHVCADCRGLELDRFLAELFSTA